MSKTTYTAVIEQDEESGIYVGYVPELRGAHTQAETLEELKNNLKEVIELVLEEDNQHQQYTKSHFVGTQLVTV